MDTPPWDAEGLWQRLQPWLPGVSVEVLATCASTNTTLLERARAGDALPCLLVAEQQTQGRGRIGRSWTSSAGASLTFSLSLPLARDDWRGLSLTVGVALADALEPEGSRIGLKWPNDLWLLDAPGRGRKLGGILIETVATPAGRVAVIGVGLNVLPQVAGDFASGYACLQEVDARASAPGALAAVALPLAQALRRFVQAGFPAFADGFARRDLLRGQRVSTTSPGVAEGVAEGVDSHGALLVRETTLHALSSGEVSARPVAEASYSGAA